MALSKGKGLGMARGYELLILVEGKGLGRESSDYPLALPRGKSQGRASGDDLLPLIAGKGLGRARSDDPLALSQGKSQGKASGDNPWLLKRSGWGGQAVMTPWHFPKGSRRGELAVTTPGLGQRKRAEEGER